MTTDPRISALAEALVAVDVKSIDDWWTWEPVKLAAAILAALRTNGFDIHHDEDWYAHTLSDAAEIARLRAECDGLRGLAKSGAARAHLDGAGVMVRHEGTLWECKAERCIAARELAWTPEERAAKAAKSDALRAALEAE